MHFELHFGGNGSITILTTKILPPLKKIIAEHIGKSERTVKTITANLVGKGLIERKNGKRNGFWEVKQTINLINKYHYDINFQF